MNSFAFDYNSRQKLQGLNFSDFITYQLAVPAKDAIFRSAIFLSPRVLELSYTSWDLELLAQDCGWVGPPFRWDEARRFLIRCELDAAFFHLYLPADEHGDWRPARRAHGCPRDETPEQLAELKRHFPTPRDAVDYIMETFPIVKRKDIQKYGDYRTKLVILDIYDRMQTAIATGEPYQTLLDPPPGDPRATHLPKGQRRPAGEAYELTDLLNLDLAGDTIPVRVTDAAGETEDMPFRFLIPEDPLPDRNQVVIVRHPELRQGDANRPIAVGKFLWSRQQDMQTGEPIVTLTLRGFGPTTSLQLLEADWKDFRPLAVAVHH